MLIVGSAALAIHAKNLGVDFRTPQDIDFICTDDEMLSYAKIHDLRIKPLSQFKVAGYKDFGQHEQKLVAEFELLHESKSGQRYMAWMAGQNRTWPARYLWTSTAALPMIPAPLEVLYSIKLSHRHYPRNWAKHMDDIRLLKAQLNFRNLSAQAEWSLSVHDVLSDITEARRIETEQRIGRIKTPSLDRTADQFFADNVSNKTFIHDEIHGVMAHREVPMFEFIKKFPGTDKVACSKQKFDDLCYQDRIRCVLEEAYVIALERCVIPMLFTAGKPFSIKQAMDYSLRRICTTLCGGWFREFAVQNYEALQYYYDYGFVAKFLAAVDEGRIVQVGKA